MDKLRALAALLLTVMCAACGGSHTTRDPHTLVAVLAIDGGTMNPLYTQSTQDGVYTGLVYDSLTATGADLAPHPWLATSWTSSPDGLRWTVELRRGVTWSDGAPFTSRDVLTTYRIMRDPKTAYNDVTDVDYIKSVVADGPYRVRFVLQRPSALFVANTLGQPMLPDHIIGNIPPDRQRFSSLGEHPVGTGPYMLQSWQHDSETVFVRNPHFWHGPAKIPRIDFRVIFNDQAQLEALENGSADLLDSLGYTRSMQLAHDAPQIKLLTFSSLYVDTVEINFRRPALADLAVRQAMMYGYDRAAVVHGFFHDQVQPANQVVVPALKRWFNPHTMQYPYDPAKARALLDAAGWKPGPDGIRRKGNLRLSFEMLVNQGSAAVLDELLTFVADMRTIGIDVYIRQIDFPTLTGRQYAGKFDLVADARGGTTDPDWTVVFASWAKAPNGANTTFYSDPIVDRTLRQGIRTLDYSERRRYYDVMQARMAETLPMLFWYTQYAATAYSPRLKLDPKVTLQFPLLYYNVFDWTLDS